MSPAHRCRVRAPARAPALPRTSRAPAPRVTPPSRPRACRRGPRPAPASRWVTPCLRRARRACPPCALRLPLAPAPRAYPSHRRALRACGGLWSQPSCPLRHALARRYGTGAARLRCRDRGRCIVGVCGRPAPQRVPGAYATAHAQRRPGARPMCLVWLSESPQHTTPLACPVHASACLVHAEWGGEFAYVR